MERDASAAPDVLPPIEWKTTLRVAGFGIGLCALAAVLGLAAEAIGDPPGILHTARLWLVFVGAVSAGVAISFRPELWQTWVLGAGAALLAVGGTPGHWDSFRLLFGVLTAVALLRAALLVLPAGYRLAAVSGFLLLHFFGILLATTSPPPTPWMVDQLYRRVYEPYLHFVYLRNAYHFYSPEPGPASIVVCLLKTDIGDEVGADGVKRKKYKMDWIVLPRRSTLDQDHVSDIRDPLGVTYYRRLSLTDAIGHTSEGMSYETFEKSEIFFRRKQLTLAGSDPYIPLHPKVLGLNQYRFPAPVVSRYYLPSYAQHILMDLPGADRERTTVKIYRIEHRTLDVGSFTGKLNYDHKPGDPYYPTTYYPYFLGEFGFLKDPDTGKIRVDLKDPREPMLYWLVPVVERVGGVPGDPNKKDYVDYFSIHAGSEFDWRQLR